MTPRDIFLMNVRAWGLVAVVALLVTALAAYLFTRRGARSECPAARPDP
jgi:hypothetical protein